MANEDVLGPRKTMFVLVIVVGCFAVLWPRILSPLILGNTQEQLKPNKLDREAGCCEVLFEPEIAVLEIVNEVCNTIVQGDLKSPYAAAECRKYVNETCGLDIAVFLKRSENVGKTTKMLLDTMKTSNSSCLKEHFGVPVMSMSTHQAYNSWTIPDTLKQERPPTRGVGPHPALRERGRAIPPGAPTPSSRPMPLPPHVRVRSSPLSVYFELDIKPPPIPGMRPPLGSPGGPVPAPKSSMGFVMPIYTICIIVFFVYTLSKILFKRTGPTPYEAMSPDPQFRRRVFRDDSRTSPDKLVVTAISGLVAEVQQQMEASYAQNQQRQDVQDNHTRPYTNGTIIHNSGPVHIVANEYREGKDKTPEKEKESSPEPNEPSKEPSPQPNEPSKEPSPEPKEFTPEPREPEPTPEPENKEPIPETDTTEPTPEPKTKDPTPESKTKESTPEPKTKEPSPESETNEPSPETKTKEPTPELETKEPTPEYVEDRKEQDELSPKEKEYITDKSPETEESGSEPELEPIDIKDVTEDFLSNTKDSLVKEKQSTPELLEEALKEDKDEELEEKEEEEDEAQEKTSVKHEADQVKSIFLETEIPQQSRVLVADFAEDRADEPKPTKHASMMVSGKMTLSLIQDAPRETPERDAESTLDDFTTASGVTHPAAKKEEEELSDEEIDEEIEVEEIEEEVEEEEEPPKVEKKPEAV